MSLLVPNIYQKSIYTINYQKLKKNNVKCLLFDRDNTCIGYKEKTITKELKKLFKDLTKMGFQVIIFSNASSKRLATFKDLDVICYASAKKPFSKNFKQVLTKYNYKKEEVCIIGDQLFTDILGGNRVGIITCLVDPLTNEDLIFTKILRSLERLSFKKLAKKNILTEGVYYE